MKNKNGNRPPLSRLKSLVENRWPIVFSDLDKTLRWGKKAIDSENKTAILKFRENGGLFIPITGGPGHHVPSFLINPIGFAESGGLLVGRKENFAIVTDEGLSALECLKSKLDVSTEDGPDIILGKYEIIIEGPRIATLTIVTGKHPLYRGITTDTPIETIGAAVREIIDDCSLPLELIIGTADNYSWLDVTTSFRKENAVMWLLESIGRESAYFMGDGMNDYAAMELPGLIPIGFENSIPEIKKLIEVRRGILISKAGPDGGVAEALLSLISS